jgi:ATP-dependent DNA helicase DinG
MVTARYAGFLQRSLPPFWATTDRELVLAALRRLDEVAPPPVPVQEPALRGLTGLDMTSETGSEIRSEIGSELGSGIGAVDRPSMTADQVPAGDPRPVAGPPPVPPSPRTAVTVGYAWTSEQDAELRDAVEAGIDLDDIVDHLELPVDAIQARLGQLGLQLVETPTLSPGLGSHWPG